MTKTAWQKMLKLPEERGARERLSSEENWLHQSWCDFLSCPGSAWLAAAQRAVPPCRRGTGGFPCGGADVPAVPWTLVWTGLSPSFPFP